jgi:hypothetical protein
MKTPIVVGALALALAGMLAAGQALAESTRPLTRQTAHEKAVEREAMRRAAVEAHEKKKAEFKRDCTKGDLNPAQLEACRAAYRRL